MVGEDFKGESDRFPFIISHFFVQSAKIGENATKKETRAAHTVSDKLKVNLRRSKNMPFPQAETAYFQNKVQTEGRAKLAVKLNLATTKIVVAF